jgi:HPt (histidine-containing phosphotransfer) domain-containing protein
LLCAIISLAAKPTTEYAESNKCFALPSTYYFELTVAVQSAKTDPILDFEGTLARFGGDKDLFVEMSGILLEDMPRLVAELGQAVEANNATDVRARAHALKGLLAGCGGVRAANITQLLENAGESSDLSQAATLFATLTNEVDELTRVLQQYRS